MWVVPRKRRCKKLLETRVKSLPIRHLLFALALLLAACRDAPVLHDLSEKEANRLMGRLSYHSIQAQKVVQADGAWTIEVPTGQVVEALNYIQSERLLVGRDRTPPEAPGLLATQSEQRFAYERGLSATIEETLLAIEGLVDARVHLNLIAAQKYATQSPSSGTGSAAVILIKDTSFSLALDNIRAIVSGATGIPIESVNVVVSEVQLPKVKPSLQGSLTGPSAAGAESQAWGWSQVASSLWVQSLVGILLSVFLYFGYLRMRRLRPGSEDDVQASTASDSSSSQLLRNGNESLVAEQSSVGKQWQQFS